MQIIQQQTREQLLLLLTQDNPEAKKSELENFIDKLCLLSLSLIKKFFHHQ